MSHEIEQLADGSAAFFTAREPAWHKLGTVTDDALTAADALRIAKLADWNVRKVPAQVMVPNKEGTATFCLDVPDKFTVIRDNPVTGLPDALGVVGKVFHPVQNEEVFQVLDNIVDESGAHFETAGSLYNGRRCFVSLKMPEAILVGGKDPIDLYLLASNNHDGSGALRIDITPVRTVCRNTQLAAWASAQRTWKARHTISATQRIAEARKALDLTWKYTGEFEAIANELVEATFPDDEFETFLQSLVPDVISEEPSRAKTERDKVVDTIADLYFESPTQLDIRGTKWGALNAVTEYVDWAAPVRGKSDDARATRQLGRLTSVDDSGLETKALTLLRK